MTKHSVTETDRHAEVNLRIIDAASRYHHVAYDLALLVQHTDLYRTDPDVRVLVTTVLSIHADADTRPQS
jgi:hypothetical protein